MSLFKSTQRYAIQIEEHLTKYKEGEFLQPIAPADKFTDWPVYRNKSCTRIWTGGLYDKEILQEMLQRSCINRTHQGCLPTTSEFSRGLRVNRMSRMSRMSTSDHIPPYSIPEKRGGPS